MVESNGLRSTTAAAPAAVGGFFRVPGLFVRLSSSKGGGVSSNAAGSVDPDSVWSPTSPLDFKRSPPRLCLGLADALAAADETGSLHFGGRSSFLDSIKPFLDLARTPMAAAVCGGEKKATAAAAAASLAGVAAAVTLDDSNEYDDDDCEEYTCVISRGANPRTTHIRAGETVEVVRKRDVGGGGGCRKVIFSIEPLSDQQPSSSPAARSGRCCCCMKRLSEDRDIFMYLGEKAFCSNECRNGYIEEEIEEADELMILVPAPNL